MTLATPHFTHVYRATVKERGSRRVTMRFEVAADVRVQAEQMVEAFIADKHQALHGRGYVLTIKRVVRNYTEAMVLVDG